MLSQGLYGLLVAVTSLLFIAELIMRGDPKPTEAPPASCTTFSGEVYQPEGRPHVLHLEISPIARSNPQHLFHYLEDVMSLQPSLLRPLRSKGPCLLALSLDPRLYTPLQRSNLRLLTAHAGCTQLVFIRTGGLQNHSIPIQSSLNLQPAARGGIYNVTEHTRSTAFVSISPQNSRSLVVRPGATAYVLQDDGVGILCQPMAEGVWKVTRSVSTTRLRRGNWMSRPEWRALTAFSTTFCANVSQPLPSWSEVRAGSTDKAPRSSRIYVLNRTSSRRLLMDPKCEEIPAVHFIHDKLHDANHICYYVNRMKASQRIIFPHGYTGVLLLYAEPDQIIDEFYPCNYHKMAYMEFKTFTTYLHTHHQCSCNDFWHYYVSQYIDLTTCMKSLPCRSFSRSQNIALRCFSGPEPSSISFQC